MTTITMLNDLFKQSPGLLQELLKDHATGGGIVWATSDYGEAIPEDSEITPEQIHTGMIIPRAMKSRENKKSRTKGKAEVFTPTWVVDKMVSEVMQEFASLPLGAFLETTWLEVTCGEGPYLTSRYEPATGADIALGERVGFVDRKLQRLNAECLGKDVLWWMLRALKVYQASYGYEFQGDSLYLARLNMLATAAENYRHVFKQDAPHWYLLQIAQVISWNILQMDGLKNTVPYAPGVDAVVKDWVNDAVIPFKELGV